MSAKTFYGTVYEDGTYSVLARVTSLDGTGTQVLPIEGKCLKQADLASIGCRVFNLGTNKDATVGVEITPAPSVSISSSVFDTLLQNGWDTSKDAAGYNFRHDVPPDYTPSPNNWYLVEYKFTLTNNGILWLLVKVKTESVMSHP